MSVGYARKIPVSLFFALARLKYPADKMRVRWEISPWIVEAALEPMGSRRLSKEEQREIWKNTRSPQTVSWPDWWAVRA